MEEPHGATLKNSYTNRNILLLLSVHPLPASSQTKKARTEIEGPELLDTYIASVLHDYPVFGDASVGGSHSMKNC